MQLHGCMLRSLLHPHTSFQRSALNCAKYFFAFDSFSRAKFEFVDSDAPRGRGRYGSNMRPGHCGPLVTMTGNFRHWPRTTSPRQLWASWGPRSDPGYGREETTSTKQRPCNSGRHWAPYRRDQPTCWGPCERTFRSPSGRAHPKDARYATKYLDTTGSLGILTPDFTCYV